MNIQVNPVNFSCKTNALSLNRKRQCAANLINRWFKTSDTFIRTSFNIDKDLNNVKLNEKINKGRHAEVYRTNYDGYVIRITHGTKFNAALLKKVNDPNGLILAANSNNTIQLMKFVKGEPLYGNNWIGENPISKRTYFKEFKKIKKLPDKTFAEYIRDVINIRKNGYDIDDVNPNNFLLDGEHIGIVDLEKNSDIQPILKLNDFNPLVNKNRLIGIMQTMTPTEVRYFAGEIKKFYDRLIKIATDEGYTIRIPEARNNGFAFKMNLISYLYYRNWAMIKKLIDNN